MARRGDRREQVDAPIGKNEERPARPSAPLGIYLKTGEQTPLRRGAKPKNAPSGAAWNGTDSYHYAAVPGLFRGRD